MKKIYIYNSPGMQLQSGESANHNTTLSRKNKNNFPWKQTTRKSNKQTKALSERERDVNLCIVGCEI